MRSVRDRMSREMSGMTPQEQINYIRRKSATLAGLHKPVPPGRQSEHDVFPDSAAVNEAQRALAPAIRRKRQIRKKTQRIAARN